MSTLFDEPFSPPASAAAAVQRMRSTMLAVRLAFTWFGTHKTLSPEQKAQAAESFGAEGEYLSAGKKLIDTGHPKFKAVSAVRNRAVQFWKSMSLPYPESGIRLIKQSDVTVVNAQLSVMRNELSLAVDDLDDHFRDLKSAAQRRLGDLYNEDDYPATLRGLFEITWDYPSVDPPEYLRQLSPAIYQQECERVQSRFDEAVRLAEQAFLEEFARVVEHLTERLSGESDGKPKIFRDTAVTNLSEFFERFRQMNVGSSDQLEELVSRAKRIVQGVEPQGLRNSTSLRQTVATQLASVQSSLDGLLVDRPRRNILRVPR